MGSIFFATSRRAIRRESHVFGHRVGSANGKHMLSDGGDLNVEVRERSRDRVDVEQIIGA
jgi:hypothetical protein